MVCAGRCGQAHGPHRRHRRRSAPRQAEAHLHPHVDCGDFVIVINADKALLTGKKLDQKYYRTHSGYAGGLHETKYRDLMAKRPEFAFQLAVKGMLGKNKLRAPQLKRLKVYAGGEHKHAAQKPEAWA